jgi:hypothetical protein
MINLRTLVSNKESEQFIIAGRFNLKELLKMTLFSFLKGDEISHAVSNQEVREISGELGYEPWFGSQLCFKTKLDWPLLTRLTFTSCKSYTADRMAGKMEWQRGGSLLPFDSTEGFNRGMDGFYGRRKELFGG